MDEQLYPPAPAEVNSLDETLLYTELDTEVQNYKAVLMAKHYLNGVTGSHFFPAIRAANAVSPK